MGATKWICALTIALGIATPAFAQSLPKADRPEDVGVSSERLKRVTSTFQAEVDNGAIPGAVVLVARRGKVVYFEAFGFRDRESGAPMQKDSISPLASLTKPFTSVAIMMLAEEGRLTLQDPLSQYLPEFRESQSGCGKNRCLGRATSGV